MNNVNAIAAIEVVARSSPEAAARFMIPSMPFNISPIFHPAMAMYSIAEAASDAENFVVRAALFCSGQYTLSVTVTFATTAYIGVKTPLSHTKATN